MRSARGRLKEGDLSLLSRFAFGCVMNGFFSGDPHPGTMLQQTADAQPCPTELPAGYAAFTRPHFEGEEGEPQECQGGCPEV